MKKTVVFFIAIFLLLSCQQKIKDTDLHQLNGYWEIEKVILKDGQKKEYKVNPTIDYFQLQNKKGFRQKVMPQLDGTFQTNNIKETIWVSVTDQSTYLNYSTPYGKWKEEIVSLQDSVMVLKNQAEIEYQYKRHHPFSLKK